MSRNSFSKIKPQIEMPNLLDIQVNSFREFLQTGTPVSKRRNIGLQEVFNNIFPVLDSRDNFRLDFVQYALDKPKYSVKECQERGVTYSVPLKAILRLSKRENSNEDYSEAIDQEVYLGNLPGMTPKGTFIINGSERVIVSQLQRSPGVFFDESVHPNGTILFTARIIPTRGSWVEFTTNINDVLLVVIDRRKKFPVSTLLRAIGFDTNEDILQAFGLIEEVGLEAKRIEHYYDREIEFDIVNKDTGEIVVEKGVVFTSELSEALKSQGISKVKFVKRRGIGNVDLITNSINYDKEVLTKEDALLAIYRILRGSESPDIDTAQTLIERLFFNSKRYDLGLVGRYRINKRLNLKSESVVLEIEDIICVIKQIIEMRDGKAGPDDIDHLGNRRIRTVSEQLAAQFSVGLSRMAKTIKERMNLRESSELNPTELVNARTVSSVINTFFGTSQLSQFMDQTNPLAELTHKRRLSALGPGGLTRDRAGFEVRDVHYTHYGRLCPIETPEGPNIGLIASMCTYAQINDLGFLETPYRKVVDGKVTDEIVYLSADDEDRYVIAQANAPISPAGEFLNPSVKCRIKGDFPVMSPEQIHFMDVAPQQIVSAAAAMIPFLEHDDANRALMGSNMQRQGVPLLTPDSPIVGTGMEKKVAHDSRVLILSEYDGIVEKVDAEKITLKRKIEKDDNLYKFGETELIEYSLTKFMRTNKNTCYNHRVSVRVGDVIKKGDVLADANSTEDGEISLGRNMVVAFMPWNGYNFEDAIVISEKVVKEDIYTSIHIEEYELEVRDTKRGEEEFTREIPNVSEEATKDLDERGIIRIGAEVKPDDILIGKVTPKGETDPTPEEKLLKAIFGDKAGDVKDASKRAPSSLKGVVIDTKLFTRKRKDPITKKKEKIDLENLEKSTEARHREIKELRDIAIKEIIAGKKANFILDKKNHTIIAHEGEKITHKMIANVNFDNVEWNQEWLTDNAVNEKLQKVITNYEDKLGKIDEDYEMAKYKIVVGDELPPEIVQLAKVYVAQKRKLQVGDKMAGRHGNKGVVSRIVPIEDMPFLADGTPVDIVLNPLGVPSRMNIGQIYETMLGWAGKILGIKYATPVFDGAKLYEVREQVFLSALKQRGLEPEEFLNGDWNSLQEKLVEIGIHPDFIDTMQIQTPRELMYVYRNLEDSETIDQLVTIATEDGEVNKRIAKHIGLPIDSMSFGRYREVASLIANRNTDLKKLSDLLSIKGLTAKKLQVVREKLAKMNEVLQYTRVAVYEKSFNTFAKTILYDGQTGMPFEQAVTVGVIYIFKLAHLVDDKMHARSIGPYSLITQQPLGGKAQFGGQRFGEMEVWALEAYGASHTLQEILTVKSDDVNGRSRVYEAIVKGENSPDCGTPESFNVLIKELQGLALDVTLK